MARSNATRLDVKASPSRATAAADPKGAKRKESYRETAEAVAVAFILALVVRGFVAEAFVIPTGSMAPTLMGRHKEVTCPECGYLYAVNASEETEGSSGDRGYARRVYSGICVNCRFQAKVGDDPSYKGDRILVMKFPYEMPNLPGSSAPSRWDVVVFRYPEEPETSYIKRLVGLPGETIRVWHGDVFIKPPGASEFRQERKPLEHQRAMQMMVYDDAHRPSSLKDRPEWRRWVSSAPEAVEEETAKPGTFLLHSADSAWAELRYRHMVPDPGQWRALKDETKLPSPPAPSLVTDFYSYNTGLYADNSDLTGEVSRDQESAWLQPHWVGDLTLSCRVAPEAAAGVVRFELIEGGVSNLCEINLYNGDAVLSHAGKALAKKATGVSWRSAHSVTFANVDNRLTLWVDDRPVFGEGANYDDAETAPAHRLPTAEDLAPARVAAFGAKVRVSALVLKRDIYYTVNPMRTDYGNTWDPGIPRTPAELARFLADPSAVAALGPLKWDDFPVTDDHFLMLGDNSPRSKDSRGWSTEDRAWEPEPQIGRAHV